MLEYSCSPYWVCYALEFTVVVVQGGDFPYRVGYGFQFSVAVIGIGGSISVSVCSGCLEPTAVEFYCSVVF